MVSGFNWPTGSLGTCDSFLNVFQNKGLRREVICPYASSVEATTVSVRRLVRLVCYVTAIALSLLKAYLCRVNMLAAIIDWGIQLVSHTAVRPLVVTWAVIVKCVVCHRHKSNPERVDHNSNILVWHFCHYITSLSICCTLEPYTYFLSPSWCYLSTYWVLSGYCYFIANTVGLTNLSMGFIDNNEMYWWKLIKHWLVTGKAFCHQKAASKFHLITMAGQIYIDCEICRPGRSGPNAAGRGILSMQGLSYGVVRVDTPNSLTSLTLQDCGQVLPGGIDH